MPLSATHTPTPLVLVLNAATEIARKKLADQYVMTYWIYQNKLPFTTGEKLQEVSLTTRLILMQILFLLFTLTLLPFVSADPQLMQCLNFKLL
jgi:hypothetical protein